ncbi:hypothetical protein [Pseudomonas sp. Leaf58]|uniref:hypothetical protein n=1 Tax=Pseudomonas sp. Leaf58 TaxID=1736226 RepID=UPI0012E95C3A|nr:hypothetical protein [Pseudomonas sp. Leaf58]
MKKGRTQFGFFNGGAMNKKIMPHCLAIVLMCNAMIFLGFFLGRSIQAGVLDWQRMLPCLLFAVAAAVWSTWLYLDVNDTNQALRRELFDTKDELMKALRKTVKPSTVVSASASSKDRPRKTSWRAN